MEVPICKHLICLPTRLQSLKGWWALLVAIQKNLHDLSTGEKKHAPTCCAMVSKCHAVGGIFIAQFTRDPYDLKMTWKELPHNGPNGSIPPIPPIPPCRKRLLTSRWTTIASRSQVRNRSVGTNVLALGSLGSLGGWQRFYAKSSEKQIEDNKQQTTRTKHLLSTFFQHSFNPPALPFVEWCCDATYIMCIYIYIYIYTYSKYNIIIFDNTSLWQDTVLICCAVIL